jgi:hypothetical protein
VKCIPSIPGEKETLCLQDEVVIPVHLHLGGGGVFLYSKNHQIMAQPSETQVFERLQSYSFVSDPEFFACRTRSSSRFISTSVAGVLGWPSIIERPFANSGSDPTHPPHPPHPRPFLYSKNHQIMAQPSETQVFERLQSALVRSPSSLLCTL